MKHLNAKIALSDDNISVFYVASSAMALAMAL